MIRVIVNGTVMKVRDSVYADKRTKEQISMLYVDVYDVTLGLAQLSCRLSEVAFRPEAKQEITADVVGARPSTFGGGVNFSIRNLQVAGLNGNGNVPPLPPAVKK